MTERELASLSDLASQVATGCIVEVGSWVGQSTIALADGTTKSGGDIPIYSIEPHEAFRGLYGHEFGPEDRADYYRNMLISDAYKTVRLVNLSSEIVAPGWRIPVSLLFIDGDHSYAGVKRDYDCWRPHLQHEAVIVFDDAQDQEAGPSRLVKELVEAGECSVKFNVGKMCVLRVGKQSSAA